MLPGPFVPEPLHRIGERRSLWVGCVHLRLRLSQPTTCLCRIELILGLRQLPAATCELLVELCRLVAELRHTASVLEHPGPARARDQPRRESRHMHAGHFSQLVIGCERRFRMRPLAANPRETGKRAGANRGVGTGGESRVQVLGYHEISARKLGLFRLDQRCAR